MSVDWPAFVHIVKAHERFLITSHIRPDCDALGSELGLAHVLRKLGKQVRIVNGQTTPNNLAFIDSDKCKLCRKCVSVCPTNAIIEENFPPRKVKPEVKKECEPAK